MKYDIVVVISVCQFKIMQVLLICMDIMDYENPIHITCP